MIGFLDSKAGRVLEWLVGAALLVTVALAIGRMMPSRPEFGIVAALFVLALGVTAAEPAAIPLLSLPLLLVVRRVGVGGFDLSVSDAVLFVATIVALVFAPRPFSRPMRTILWLSALYQFATLFTVVANPYLANVVEWFHAWTLVSGALLVGWAVGRAGYARAGLSLLLAASVALASLTLGHAALQYAEGDFSAVYLSWPYSMHKNFVGTVLGFAAVIAYARPAWVGWSRRVSLAAFWLLAAGVVVTQSRQAIVALGIVLLLISLRRDAHRRRSRAIVFAVAPALVFAGALVQEQVEEGSVFNSVFQRLSWYHDTVVYWSESPWIGHGLRFWRREGGLPFQPPNLALEVLASSGVLGLLAFLILLAGTVVVVWRLDPVYGTVALAVLVSRLVQSQFDIFWVAVQLPIVFSVVGMALGAEALYRERQRLADIVPAKHSSDVRAKA